MWLANSPDDGGTGTCDNCKLDITDWCWVSEFVIGGQANPYTGEGTERPIVMCKLCVMAQWADRSGPFFKLFAGAPDAWKEALVDLHRVQIERVANEVAGSNTKLREKIMAAAYPPEAAEVT